MKPSQQFLERVERFLVDTKMPPTRFGVEAAGDPSFVFDLRKGRKPNLDLAHEVDEYMRRHRAMGTAAA